MQRSNAVDSQTLLTCCLLQLDPRVENKRLELYRIFVELVLLESPGALAPERIRESIDDIAGQRDFMSAEEVTQAIGLGTRRGTIQPANGEYVLVDQRRNEVQAAVDADLENRERFRKGLIESMEIEIGEALESEVADAVCDLVDRMIRSIIYENSLRIARELVTIEGALMDLEGIDAWSEFEAAVNKWLPPDRSLIRSQVKAGVQSYFRAMPDVVRSYLRSAHCALVLNQMLSLDPRTQALQQAWFAARRFYLDTNVVLAYLFEGQQMHDVVKEVLDATRRLQVQLFVSPITLEELKGQVRRAKSNYRWWTDDPLVKRMALTGDDAILATYLRLRRKQPSLEWEAFIATLGNMEDLIFDQAGVLVEEEGFEEAKESDKLDRIRSVVSSAKAWSKSERVVEHDALNCCLIYNLRSNCGPDERGQRLWLLTMDWTLGQTQRDLVGSGDFSNPYCMSIDQWGTIVIPAERALGFELEDFMTYLAQSRLGALPEPDYVQLDFLETIRDAPLDVDRLMVLPVDHARRAIICLQKDREARSLLEESAQVVDEDRKAELQAQLDQRLEDAVEETDPLRELRQDLEGRIRVLRKEIEARDRRIEELEAYVESRKRLTFVDRLRYLLGFGIE